LTIFSPGAFSVSLENRPDGSLKIKPGDNHGLHAVRMSRAPAPKAASRRNNKVSNDRSMKPAKSETKKVATHLSRVFSDAKVKPFDQIEWDRRTAEITTTATR